MLARPRRLTAARSFALVRQQGRVSHTPLLTVTTRRSGEANKRVGFVVSRRVGGAVVRNLVRRRLRMATRDLLPDLLPGYDIVVVARPSLAVAAFPQLADALRGALHRARVLGAASAAPASRPDRP